jgi:hypothetical protein
MVGQYSIPGSNLIRFLILDVYRLRDTLGFRKWICTHVSSGGSVQLLQQTDEIRCSLSHRDVADTPKRTGVWRLRVRKCPVLGIIFKFGA